MEAMVFLIGSPLSVHILQNASPVTGQWAGSQRLSASLCMMQSQFLLLLQSQPPWYSWLPHSWSLVCCQPLHLLVCLSLRDNPHSLNLLTFILFLQTSFSHKIELFLNSLLDQYNPHNNKKYLLWGQRALCESLNENGQRQGDWFKWLYKSVKVTPSWKKRKDWPLIAIYTYDVLGPTSLQSLITQSAGLLSSHWLPTAESPGDRFTLNTPRVFCG